MHLLIEHSWKAYVSHWFWLHFFFTVIMLPTVKPSMLPPNVCPLLVSVILFYDALATIVNEDLTRSDWIDTNPPLSRTEMHKLKKIFIHVDVSCYNIWFRIQMMRQLQICREWNNPVLGSKCSENNLLCGTTSFSKKKLK